MGKRAKAAETAFDVFTLLVTIFDIVSDVVVAVQFYRKEQYNFFYASCAIFLLCQFCYSAYFIHYALSRKEYKWKFLTFILLLPFAELVPLFCFLDAFSWSPTRWISEKFHLHTTRFQDHPDEDPRAAALRRKLHQHGGFFVETICESIPQSLLQLIAMVFYRKTNVISVLSILLSVISICSKAYIISYSIRRRVFVWAMTGIIYDVVAMFLTVSLLFDSRAVSFGSYFTTLPLLSRIWFFRFLAASAFLLLIFLVGFFVYVFDRCYQRHVGARWAPTHSLGWYALYFALGLLSAGPFCIIAEAMHSSLGSVFLASNRPNSTRNSASVVRLFRWMQEGPSASDRHLRRSCVWIVDARSSQTNALAIRALDPTVIALPFASRTLRQLRKAKHPNDRERRPEWETVGDAFIDVLSVVALVALVPSKLYSLAYPYAMFFQRLWEEHESPSLYTEASFSSSSAGLGSTDLSNS